MVQIELSSQRVLLSVLCDLVVKKTNQLKNKITLVKYTKKLLKSFVINKGC